jgi:hypothetical protein
VYASWHRAQAAKDAGGSNTLVGRFTRTQVDVPDEAQGPVRTGCGQEDDVAGDRRRLLLGQRRASQAGTEPESCCWMCAADAGSPAEPLLHGF